MAKPRKPKPEDSKPANSSAVVRHQKLCLSIDTDLRRIYGYTELEIAVPDIGFVGLHAENLGIDSVFVDGEATEFEYYPRSESADAENRWAAVSSPSSAAVALGAFYLTTLKKESTPNLLINCCNKVLVEQMNLESGVPELDKVKQNVKSVRVNYWVDKAETGIHFEDTVVHTDNQIRRARCWFPCIDNDNHRCCYDLEFTVALNHVAVSNGTLLYQILVQYDDDVAIFFDSSKRAKSLCTRFFQVLSNDDPPRKVYVYKLDVPVTARWISLAVGPFEILPDQHNMLISHMCLAPNTSSLRNSVEFFHSAFSEYEEYLDARFPFGSYKQVFLPPEMVISSSTLGASFGIFSSQVLYDEKVIDQTIDTCIKLAFSLARQWFGVYVTPESPDDEWLVDGLAGFMTDLFIKKYLGNNEARYRRYKANMAVCTADDSGATALSSSSAMKDLHGTHSLGIYGKIRSWKSVAILQMLEKQMGPDFFKKILQTIISRAQSAISPLRTLSTKEFRHFANKIGNLERPFLKEFFPRWVGSHGCPLLRMGFSYNKRKNIVELAVLRECTATMDSRTSDMNGNQDSENRDGDIGWPGVMTIRVYELDCMSDHPDLPLAGDPWQLIEIPCHSKLAAKRYQKPKKGAKPDTSDDNVDTPAADVRTSMESPLSWIRADPDMEYLAEIHMNQPVHMWINQLEKDEDVVAQAQAIKSLESLPQLSFSVVNALNNFLNDSKAFWRVRVEAAHALANTTSEENDFSGLQHLIKFYKSRRFDADIGLPKPNDFRDFAEYFVLEAIPGAIAMVRAADKKSPREAVEFILQLLKYNDNNGNPYSDVFWLAALVESIGELEIGHESILLLSSLLKCIDRLMQFDRLMPSYNGILTSSCIRTLTQIALKLSGFICLDHIFELIKHFRGSPTIWHVRLEASKALLDLEFHSKGIDAALLLFVKFMSEEPSLRGQAKLSVHIMLLCQLRSPYSSDSDIKTTTLLTLLELFESHKGFNNVFLRHQLFCIIQVLAGRAPTVYGVPWDKLSAVTPDACIEATNVFASIGTETKPPEHPIDILNAPPENAPIPEASKEVDTISSNHERKAGVVKIRLKQSTGGAGKPDEADNRTTERSQAGHPGTEHGASSSVSVDAPVRNSAEAASICNQNLEEVNSFHDRGSRITASIGSAKVASEGDNLGKELQCTADSSKVSVHLPPDATSPPSSLHDNNVDTDAQKFASLQNLSTGRHGDSSLGQPGSPPLGKDDKIRKKKDKEKKRKREDPEYLEKKKLKKEKKRKEKERAKLLQAEAKAGSTFELADTKQEPIMKPTILQFKPKEKEIAKLLQPVGSSGMVEDRGIMSASVQVKPINPGGSELLVETKSEQATGTAAPKIRIKLKRKPLE